MFVIIFSSGVLIEQVSLGGSRGQSISRHHPSIGCYVMRTRCLRSNDAHAPAGDRGCRTRAVAPLASVLLWRSKSPCGCATGCAERELNMKGMGRSSEGHLGSMLV